MIVCALPAEGQLFGFDPESGRIAWTACVTESIKGADPRIANVTMDQEVVVAGLWGSRLWALDLTNGQHRWTRETCRYARPIHAVVAGSRVFGLAADENAYAFDKATGQRLWISRVGFCESAEHALVHGTNLVLWQTAGRESDRSHVLAVSQADGRQQWQTPLLRNEPGALGCLGDFAVSAAGRILQRIDPRTGTAGAYLELPTLKKSVTLYGQEIPVFISHPLALAPPDTVYAFTVDGSLWCAHLPQSSTNLVLPSPEISQRSPEPAAEQLALTNRPTPPLPAELKVWRAELEREGRTNVWTTLETKIDQVWVEAQEYARIVGGFPHIAICRVVVPRGEDPRLVRAQMEVLEGGFFATSVRDLREPLSFRLPGCLPVDFPLKGHTGDLVFLGDVVLPAAAPQQMGSIHGRIRLDDGRHPWVAKVSASIEMGPINHPSNGFEPSQYWPEPLTGRVDTNGEFLITGTFACGALGNRHGPGLPAGRQERRGKLGTDQ